MYNLMSSGRSKCLGQIKHNTTLKGEHNPNVKGVSQQRTSQTITFD